MSSSQFSRRLTAFLLTALLLSGCFVGFKKDRILQRADSYFKTGDLEKAKIEYLNLLRLDNQNARAFQQIGFIWMEQGVPLRAIPFLFKAKQLAPQDIPVRTKLGLALQAVGQPAEARKEAVFVLQQNPNNTDAILLLADASQTKEDIADTEQQIQKFPSKDGASFHLASAILAMKKNDLGAAADEVQRAIEAEPNSAKAHATRAFLYLLRQDSARARSELKTASDLAALRSDERIKYALFLTGNGAGDEARRVLQEVVQKAPYYLPAWLGLAQIAFSEKKYDEALTFLENIFGRDSENPHARILQSQVWLAKGDPGKAVTSLDKVNSAYPNNPSVKYELGRAYIANNNPAQATVALEQAIAARSDFPQAVLMLAEVNLRGGKAQAAALAMEDLLKKHPDLPQARLLLASAYQALGRPEEATSLFREETKSAPQSADAYFKLGLALRQQKKNDEARQALEKASELVPDNFLPIDQLVEIDVAEKRYDAAAERVKKELTKHPNAATSHYLEAKVSIANVDQRDFARAEAALQKAIELDPNFLPAYEFLVGVYYSEKKLPEALNALEAELAKNPNDTRPLLLTALIHDRMKDYEKARDAYEKVVAASPNSFVALNNLAYIYAEQLNQLDKAYDLAQKARTIQPDNAMVADTLGWILYKRADYQQALGLIQESATKAPDDPEVQFHLGMTRYMMGQAEAARSALQQAVHSSVDFQGKEEAQRRLAQLENRPTGAPGDSPAGRPEAQLNEQPNDVLALIRGAEDYEKQGDAAKAAASYEQVLKLNPKLLNPALKLAQLYAGPLHQPAKALEMGRKTRDLAPNDPQIAGAIGRIAYQAGNISWAYSLLQERARQGDGDAGVLHDLAMAAYFSGKVSEARQTMQRALDAKPDQSVAEDGKWFLAMTALDRQSTQATAAQSEIEALLKAKPDYLPALMAQAALDLQRNDTKAAAGIYSDALHKYPDFAPAQKWLAGIYADDPANLGKAYDLAMKARKAIPDDPDLARTLAELAFKRKEFPYAVQLFQESAAKQPLAATDLYYLGVAQMQSRQEAKGRETLQQALAAGLPDQFAQEAKKRLAERQQK